MYLKVTTLIKADNQFLIDLLMIGNTVEFVKQEDGNFKHVQYIPEDLVISFIKNVNGPVEVAPEPEFENFVDEKAIISFLAITCHDYKEALRAVQTPWYPPV